MKGFFLKSSILCVMILCACPVWASKPVVTCDNVVEKLTLAYKYVLNNDQNALTYLRWSVARIMGVYNVGSQFYGKNVYVPSGVYDNYREDALRLNTTSDGISNDQSEAEALLIEVISILGKCLK